MINDTIMSVLVKTARKAVGEKKVGMYYFNDEDYGLIINGEKKPLKTIEDATKILSEIGEENDDTKYEILKRKYDFLVDVFIGMVRYDE